MSAAPCSVCPQGTPSPMGPVVAQPPGPASAAHLPHLASALWSQPSRWLSPDTDSCPTWGRAPIPPALPLSWLIVSAPSQIMSSTQQRSRGPTHPHPPRVAVCSLPAWPHVGPWSPAPQTACPVTSRPGRTCPVAAAASAQLPRQCPPGQGPHNADLFSGTWMRPQGVADGSLSGFLPTGREVSVPWGLLVGSRGWVRYRAELPVSPVVTSWMAMGPSPRRQGRVTLEAGS